MSDRLKIVAIIIFFEIASYLSLSITPRDDTYYLVTGAFSLGIIPCILHVNSEKLGLSVGFLAVLVVIFQGVGYLIYHKEYPVWIYNSAIKILLISQIAVIFHDWIQYERGTKDGDRSSVLPSSDIGSRTHLHEKTK
jgi:hypothetical protein